VFTNAFTSCPLCSPARGTLLTARWQCQTGMFDNVGVGYSLQEPLATEEATWLDAAAAAGYHVGYFGKWHLGTDGPLRRGAHRHDTTFDPWSKPYDPETKPHSYEGVRASGERQAEQLLVHGRPQFWGEVRAPKDKWGPFPIAQRGAQFLDEYAQSGAEQPFFLTVSTNPPHFPHYLPKGYAEIADAMRVDLPASLGDTFAGKPWFHGKPWWPCMDTSVLDEAEWHTVVAYSQAHIMMVDEALGRVLDALDRNGLTDSTTVVFTADHGDMQGAHNRFDKGPYFYEEVWRIPLIVASPDRQPATQEAFVSILDLGETFLSAVGAEPLPGRPRAGRDLAPLLGTKQRPDDWPQVAFGQYDLYNGMSFAVRAVRDERWKYAWNPQAVDELYDLAEDPHELTNLAGRPETAAAETRLRALLSAWMEDIGDDLPHRAHTLPEAGTVVATGKPGP